MYDPRLMERNELRIRSSEAAFVGREHELEYGLRTLEDALGARGRLLLLAGEPGIGKSRMADELAEVARRRGFHVVWGRCWEAGGAPAYWPWVQSLRALIRELDANALQAALAAGAVDLAQLIPEIAGLVGTLPSPVTQDPDSARFSLFDSVTTFLKNLAVARPLMLVLDDLQVADTPSLLLLRFMAGSLGDHRILLLGTYRDTELGGDHPLSTTLAELLRDHTVRRLNLRGLTREDVANLITAAAGFNPTDGLVRGLHEGTEGNALFVSEVIRLLLEEGQLQEDMTEPAKVGLPQSVREVIGRRLEHLSTECVRTLTLASVLGREFSLDALSRLTERGVDETLGLLDEALGARVITDAPGAKGRLRFSHVVIRESLYDDAGLARRIQVHRRTAEVLEALYADDIDAHLAVLAYHFLEGAPGGEVTKAIDYARRAGDTALTLLAYEEAARLYRMALQGLELRAPSDPVARCDLLLNLGDALARGGDQSGSRDIFLYAADLARAHHLKEQLARAALGYGGPLVWLRAGDDRHIIPLLEDGLAAIGEADSVLRARMLARLAGALRDDRSAEPRESLAKASVELARRLGEPATLAYALDGLYAALWKPDNPEARLAIARELGAVGGGVDERERVMSEHAYRFFVYVELEDVAAAHRELDTIKPLAEELRMPVHSWWVVASEALIALLEGRYDDAARLIPEALQIGMRSSPTEAHSAYALQMFQLRREEDRLAEVEDLLRSTARRQTWYPMFRCALVLLHCDLGREAEARAAFEALAEGDFGGIAFDNEWLLNMSLLSEIAYQLRDQPRAEILYIRLLPYANRSAFGPIEGCLGSVARYLGLLAAVCHRYEDAEAQFEKALASNARMKARPWLAHTQHDYAVMLLQRDDSRDREKARVLLEAALEACGELEMPALRRRVAATLNRIRELMPSGVAPAAKQDPNEPAGAARERPGEWSTLQDGTFVLEGEYWTVAYRGTVSRLRDSKGMRVLAQLLAEPGRPHPSLDLERLGSPGDDSTARAVASGDAGELLDEEARRAYRARVAELRAAVDEADGLRRADDVGAMREEMDFLTRELSRALGLGGRSRVAGSTAERARLNVTRAVKSALRRVEGANLDLAAHLEATVRTGSVCVYTPDPRVPITWRVSLRSVHKD